VEYLREKGAELGLASAHGFFWATGSLSSFLDNAPTYVVFFNTAKAFTRGMADLDPSEAMTLPGGELIYLPLLVAVSLGAVFMGANTYIGNGPNFMVKTIAEQSGVRMPSFFGYMLYSIMILVPLFVVVTFIFL
jgi:Na+/H+ antiporter NhaD/arsenite permease-like protein